MKDIKFKVYDIIRNKICEKCHYVDFFTQEIHVEDENGEFDILDFEDSILLRFTGLKDINGVDIYQGDVVRWDDNSDGKYWRICEVMWEKSHFVLVGITVDWKDLNTLRKVEFKFGQFRYEMDGELEIIGNIYENPDIFKRYGTEPKEK